jgi:hypothetical protein
MFMVAFFAIAKGRKNLSIYSSVDKNVTHTHTHTQL